MKTQKYKEKEGYVSLGVVKCENNNILNEYLLTIYFDEDFNGNIEKAEQSEIWKNLFISANWSRACEGELKKSFNYEFFNQSEYDFDPFILLGYFKYNSR